MNKTLKTLDELGHKIGAGKSGFHKKIKKTSKSVLTKIQRNTSLPATRVDNEK